MAKDPTARYETAEAMRRDLLEVASGREIPAAAVAAGAAAAAAQTSVMPRAESDAYADVGDRGRPPARRKSNAWLWVVLAVLLVGAGLGVAWGMGLLGVQSLPVPDLTGKTTDEAQLLISEAGFTLGEVKPEFSKEVEAGLVIDQSPVPGAPAEEGSAISFVVSKGPRQVEVPEVVGLKEDEAIQAIEDAGFVAKGLADQPSSKVPIGSVMKQSPAAGEMVDEGSQIEYVVSRGVETVAVPNVVGKKRSTAESTLKDAGFKVKVSEEYSESVDKGLVISQNPNRGIEVAKGSTVSIVVSKGPERIAVPDVIGKTEADAKAALDNAGLKAKVTYELHSNSGTVLEQSPSPDTQVARGSTVDILVDGAP